MRLTVWTVAALMLGVAMPAYAQQDKSVDGNIGFGYSAVTGEAREHTGDAGLFEAGVTFNVSPAFGIQTNYNYTALGKEKTVLAERQPCPGSALQPAGVLSRYAHARRHLQRSVEGSDDGACFAIRSRGAWRVSPHREHYDAGGRLHDGL